MRHITVACVGAGYWRKNLVRVFHDLPGVHLKTVCDLNESIRQATSFQYPEVQVVADYQKVLEDPEVEAVVLAVPAVHHFAAALVKSYF